MKFQSTLLLIVLCLLMQFCRPAGESEKTTENPIVLENKLEGTTSWLIKVPEKNCEYPDHRYCRRPQVEGYCSQTSYVKGDTLEIFVSTDPSSQYSLDIFRMGYYGGKGGRLMTSVGILDGKPQPVPTAGTNNLVECKWDKSYQMTIPKDWTSGVYLGKLTALSDSSQSYVVFIVKDDRRSDILFQSSDMTWIAYNRWPYWHAMYDEGQKPWVNTNGARISFDRPYALYVNELPMAFNPLSNGSGEFLMWEFPLAFWLEKEGYDVSYISGVDTHADREGLLRGKAYISVGHDEYWTHAMVDNVKNARDKGVNLLFLCGNSVDGTVYLDPSSDGRPNRITGRLPEREFKDEQDLMGSTSYGVGYGDIVLKPSNHWIYEGTGVQQDSILKHLLGWEYHGYPLKDDPSLVLLGSTKPTKNKFTDDNPPDHTVTIYTGSKGNFIFNAGTCFWSLPLSTPPGFQNPVCNQGDQGNPKVDYKREDPRIQRMTKNLLDHAIGS